jgi:hypothetical protein
VSQEQAGDQATLSVFPRYGEIGSAGSCGIVVDIPDELPLELGELNRLADFRSLRRSTKPMNERDYPIAARLRP